MQFSKSLVLQAAPVSSRSSLRVLPPGAKKTQRIVVGDDAGTVQCVAVRRGAEPEVDFSVTLPEGRIECISLGGGPSAPPAARERLFVSAGCTVKGVSKKGKVFFELDTCLSEPLTAMAVEGVHIYAAGESVYQHYEDGRDAHYLGCPERALAVLPLGEAVLLGCGDGAVRMLGAASGLKVEEVSLGGGGVSVLLPWEGGSSSGGGWEEEGAAPTFHAPPDALAAGRSVFYGTEGGVIGMLKLQGEGAAPGLIHAWSCAPAQGGAVTSLAAADMGIAGGVHLVVGREGGRVELHAVAPAGGLSMRWSTALGEAVRSVAAGAFSAPGAAELCALTYSGHLFLFAAGEESGGTRVAALRAEVDALRRRVALEQAAAVPSGDGASIPQTRAVVAWGLDARSGVYSLSIELPVPIEHVTLSSSVPLDVPGLPWAGEEEEGEGGGAEGGEGADEGGAYSFGLPPSPPQISLGTTALLCRCLTDPRPQPGTQPPAITLIARPPDAERRNRVCLTLRPVEGTRGEVSAIVVAKGGGAAVLRLPLKPLSLHCRVVEGVQALEAALASQWTAFRASRGVVEGPLPEEAGDAEEAGGASSSSAAAALAVSAARAAAERHRAASGRFPPSLMDALPASALPLSFPLHTLTLSAPGLSLAQLHEWLAGTLPEVPARPGAASSAAPSREASPTTGTGGDGAPASLAYRHASIGSHLLLTYGPGRLTARSDNLSTLVTLREALSAAAAAASIRVETGLSLFPSLSPARHELSLLHAPLSTALAAGVRARLAEAVREMVATEGGGEGGHPPFLHPRWVALLAHAEEAKAAGRSRARVLARLTGLVLDLYVDGQRALFGQDVAGGPGMGRVASLVAEYDRPGGGEALLGMMEAAQRGAP
jgi:hypothetical protein